MWSCCLQRAAHIRLWPAAPPLTRSCRTSLWAMASCLPQAPRWPPRWGPTPMRSRPLVPAATPAPLTAPTRWTTRIRWAAPTSTTKATTPVRTSRSCRPFRTHSLAMCHRRWFTTLRATPRWTGTAIVRWLATSRTRSESTRRPPLAAWAHSPVNYLWDRVRRELHRAIVRSSTTSTRRITSTQSTSCHHSSAIRRAVRLTVPTTEDHTVHHYSREWIATTTRRRRPRTRSIASTDRRTVDLTSRVYLSPLRWNSCRPTTRIHSSHQMEMVIHRIRPLTATNTPRPPTQTTDVARTTARHLHSPWMAWSIQWIAILPSEWTIWCSHSEL